MDTVQEDQDFADTWGKRLWVEAYNRSSKAPNKCLHETIWNNKTFKTPINVGNQKGYTGALERCISQRYQTTSFLHRLMPRLRAIQQISKGLSLPRASLKTMEEVIVLCKRSQEIKGNRKTYLI